jgi:hypothetical protein
VKIGWRDLLAVTILGAGVFLLIKDIALFLLRN